MAAKVLIVDDHPMMREGLRTLISREGDLTVCGEAETTGQALDALTNLNPDLVLADIALPGRGGVDLIKDIRALRPAVLVLVISMHDELLYAERALRAGARGYITKQEATRKVMQAIRAVLQGNIYLSEKLLSRLTAKIVGRRSPGGLAVDALTDRELRVFEMLGQGHSTRQIARQLRLHMRTIETYRARIKQKLHLNGASDLLQHAIRWTDRGSGKHYNKIRLPLY